MQAYIDEPKKMTVKQTKERKFPYAEQYLNTQLYSSEVYIEYKAEEQTDEQFNNITTALQSTYGLQPASAKERLTITDQTFSIYIQKNGVWGIKLLDYSKYEHAIDEIIKGLKTLIETGFLKRLKGVLQVQDRQEIIHYHFLILNPDDTLYKLHHHAFESIECYAKKKGTKADLFVFKYTEPVSNCVVERKFELETQETHIPVEVERCENTVKVRAGLSGDHDIHTATWQNPLSMVFAAKTEEEALNKLLTAISNRNLKTRRER